MFGEAKDIIDVSKNVKLEIPDIRTCKTCDHYNPTTVKYYEDNIGIYKISCENSECCKYIYDGAVALLDKKLEEFFNGEQQEEKEG